MRPRINRLEAIHGEIVANMALLAKEQDRTVGNFLASTLAKGAYQKMYDQYKDSNPKMLQLMEKHSVAISRAELQKALEIPWSGKNYSERIWKREHDVAHRVKEAVTRRVLEGASLDRLVKDVTDELGTDYRARAKTLIHTETAYVSGQADLLTYEKLGNKKYDFMATLDIKTSAVCRSLDGKTFDIEDAVPGKNYPPMHPRCRSTTVAHRDDRSGTRAARDKDGNPQDVDRNLSYAEWYKEYVASDPEYLTVEKMHKNKASDRKQHAAFRDLLGSNVTRDLEEFQRMKYNDPEKWNRMKSHFSYITKYPEANKACHDIYYDLKQIGIDKGVVFLNNTAKAFILADSESKRNQHHIMQRMMDRGISDDEVRYFKENAKVYFSRWNGKRETYYSDDGVSAVHNGAVNRVYKTTWRKEDFDDEVFNILEVIDRHV